MKEKRKIQFKKWANELNRPLRKTYEWPKCIPKKRFNFSYHKGNVDQNHNEITCNTSQNGYAQKKKKRVLVKL